MGLNLKELSNALNEIDKQTSYYAGNLKRQKKIKALAIGPPPFLDIRL